MKRTIIKFNEVLCNGCGICATACHEGAIHIEHGKATLIRDDYCDGLGDCLPACPLSAISFEEREALAYDEVAVLANQNEKEVGFITQVNSSIHIKSELKQWPIQIKLLPLQAPYFKQADLLIAADCCAYSYANFHQDFMKGKVTLIGCPKLDMLDYSEKLTAIFQTNDIRSIQVVRMEVPCCKGIDVAVTSAIHNSKKIIPCEIITLTRTGEILLREWR